MANVEDIILEAKRKERICRFAKECIALITQDITSDIEDIKLVADAMLSLVCGKTKPQGYVGIRDKDKLMEFGGSNDIDAVGPTKPKQCCPRHG